MTTTTVPAHVAVLLRGALYGQLGDVAEELASARRRPQADRAQVAEWHEAVARFDRTRALLDKIGWSDVEPERDVEIDLHTHRQGIEQALRDELATEWHLMNETGAAAAGQRERAAKRAYVIEMWAATAGLQVNGELIAVGQAVRQLRVERRMTESELAAAAGVTQELLGAVEAGQRDPDYVSLVRLAKALGVEPAELVRRIDAQKGGDA